MVEQMMDAARGAEIAAQLDAAEERLGRWDAQIAPYISDAVSFGETLDAAAVSVLMSSLTADEHEGQLELGMTLIPDAIAALVVRAVSLGYALGKAGISS